MRQGPQRARGGGHGEGVDGGLSLRDWFKGFKRGGKAGVSEEASAAALLDAAEEKALSVSSLDQWAGFLIPGYADTYRPYKTHPWVHRAIRVKEQAIGSVPLRLYRAGNPKPVEITTDPVLSMLSHPNEQLSGRDLLMGIVNHLDLCGNALMVVVRTGSSGALVPLNPRNVSLLRDGNRLVGYEYVSEGGARRFEPWEVLHIRYPSDDDPLWGVSPMEAVRKAYEDDVAIRTHNRGLYANSGVPRGVLTSDQIMGKDTVEENRARWESAHRGPSKSGKTAILTGGLKFEPLGITQQEFDFLEARKFGLQEVCGVFGVPSSKLNDHITDESNARVYERMFQNDTMLPLYETIADSINTQMWKLEGRQTFGPSTMFVRFDVSQVPELMRQRQEYELAEIEKVKQGIVTINEHRERLGMDPLPWGDVWWRPLGLEPTKDATVPAYYQPGEPVDDDDDTEKRVAAVVPLPTSYSSSGAPPSRKSEDSLAWLAFLSRLGGVEARMASAVSSVMDGIERSVVAGVRSSKAVLPAVTKERRPTPAEIEAMLFDIGETVVELQSAAKRPLRDAQGVGGRRGLKLAGRSSVRFRTADPKAVRLLERQLQRFAQPVAETTWSMLKGELADGLNAGETESQLIDRVRAVMDRRRSDAQRIAATETAAAVNGGINLGFEQSKVVRTKRWVTAGDEAVRDSHKAANGQEVAVGASFTVGAASLAFPGDPSAPAGEVINCRCTVVPGEIVEDVEPVTEVGA